MAKKYENRTVVLYFGNTVKEYEQIFNDKKCFLQLVEYYDSLDFGVLKTKHKEGCPRKHRFTTNQDRKRTLNTFDGEQYTTMVRQVRCKDCGAAFTILPSFIVRYKRFDADAIEKLFALLFILVQSYRDIVINLKLFSDNHKQGIYKALESPQFFYFLDPRTIWSLVMWLGVLTPAQVNLTLGLSPLEYGISDEKFAQQNGKEIYIPILLEQSTNLIWHIDRLNDVKEETIKSSLERYKKHFKEQFLKGVTLDGWSPTQNAFRIVFPDIVIQECQLHPRIKLSKILHSLLRRKKITKEQFHECKNIFAEILNAKNQEEYQNKLQELPEFMNKYKLLKRRKKSLIRKQDLYTKHLEYNQLAKTTTFLDQKMKFLDQKLFSMQTFRGDKSALCTLNAWAIIQNFWKPQKGAKFRGISPVERSGAKLEGIPFIQWINLMRQLIIFIIYHKFMRLSHISKSY